MQEERAVTPFGMTGGCCCEDVWKHQAARRSWELNGRRRVFYRLRMTCADYRGSDQAEGLEVVYGFGEGAGAYR
jgi:hypothetical protein